MAFAHKFYPKVEKKKDSAGTVTGGATTAPKDTSPDKTKPGDIVTSPVKDDKTKSADQGEKPSYVNNTIMLFSEKKPEIKKQVFQVKGDKRKNQ